MNMRHAVRHGKALRLKITHRHATCEYESKEDCGTDCITNPKVDCPSVRHFGRQLRYNYGHSHRLLE